MERPVLCRTAAAIVLVLLLWQSTDAARGNSLQDHVLRDAPAAALAAESMMPAWQEVTDEDMDMYSTRRLLAEYALNIADDEDDTVLQDTQAAAVVEEEPEVPAWQEVADEDQDIDSTRKLLAEYAVHAAEDDGPEPVEHTGDSITLSRLLIEEADNSQTAEDPGRPTQETAAASPPQGDTTADPDDDVGTSLRRLLQDNEQAAGEAQASAQDLAPAWQEVIDTAQASRKLMQAAVNTTLLREQAKAVLLASDAFGMVYTGGNFARAIFALMTPMVVAGQTGVVAVDANYLLNLSQLLAQFVAMLGDLLSKGARLTADGIAPI